MKYHILVTKGTPSKKNGYHLTPGAANGIYNYIHELAGGYTWPSILYDGGAADFILETDRNCMDDVEEICQKVSEKFNMNVNVEVMK